jgi:N-acetylglucosamine-6-sulfatase
MSMRWLVLMVALAAAGALAIVLPGGSAPAQTAQARPNVVLVMTDDQTVEQMKALERVRTRIGRVGTTFDRNFSVYPLCCPSRSTYLTGQYSHNHKVFGNKPPTGGFYRLDSTNTLPVWMSAAGYATAHIGKYLNTYGSRGPTQVPNGWQEWYGSVDPTTYNYRHYCLNENGHTVAYGANKATERACPGAQRRPQAYMTDNYTGKAVDYIRRHAPAAQPFFLSVAYLAPHGGGPNKGPDQRCRGSAKPAARHRGAFNNAKLPRPKSFNEKDVRDKPKVIRDLPRFTSADVARITTNYRCRRESLLAADEGVGRILDQLKASGELGRTLVIFTSDNGFFSGEHRVPGGKIRVYEPSVRVPVLMRGPGVPAGRHVKALTGNIDLASTVLDAGGAKPGRLQDGVSLLDVAAAPKKFAGRRILLQNNPAETPGYPSYRAIRTSRYKYVEYRHGGYRELYDLKKDPQELRSLHRSKRYAKIRRKLARRLHRLRTCRGATCR